MGHRAYSNAVKALLHIHTHVDTLTVDTSIKYDADNSINFRLFKDFYETSLVVKSEDDDIQLFKIRFLNYYLSKGITFQESLEQNSFCNTSSRIDPIVKYPRINFIQLDMNNIKLYTLNNKDVTIDRNNLESNYFQTSTVADSLDPVETFEYLAQMYDHYTSFMPQGLGVGFSYYNNEEFYNTEFIEFITKKIWGMSALA